MSGKSEPVGTLEVALAHAARLLETNPALAIEQAREILTAVPGHPQARLVLGAAYRRTGRTPAALEVLEPLAQEQARAAAVHLELGVARGEAGRADEAVAALTRATQLKPDSPDGWRLLADHLDAIGDAGGADRARARHIKTANRDPRLMEAAAALVANDLPVAEARLLYFDISPPDTSPTEVSSSDASDVSATSCITADSSAYRGAESGPAPIFRHPGVPE